MPRDEGAGHGAQRGFLGDRPQGQQDRSYPCRIHAIGGSGGLAAGLCWQSHQLPPGHSSWCAARQAEQTMMPLWVVVRGARGRAHQRGRGPPTA